MPNPLVDRITRVLILVAFMIAAFWLVCCAKGYDDAQQSSLPMVMCAAESILLTLTGAVVALRGIESEYD